MAFQEGPSNYVMEQRIKAAGDKSTERRREYAKMSDKRFGNLLHDKLWLYHGVFHEHTDLIEEAVSRLTGELSPYRESYLEEKKNDNQKKGVRTRVSD